MAVLTTDRPCYICHKSPNPIIGVEDCERRFDRPFMPEGVYRQARCQNCATFYVDSDVTDEYLKDIYSMETVEYVQNILTDVDVTREDLIARRKNEFRHDWDVLKRYRAPKAGDKLLDMGCQTGEFGDLAAEDGVRPNGIELSVQYAELCRKKWGPDTKVHCGPLETAEFAPGEFQYITAFETLEHICDPIAALQKLGGWLSPDGIVAVSVPSTDYFHFKWWLLVGQPFAKPFRRLVSKKLTYYEKQVLVHSHIYSFSRRSMTLMLQRAGYEPLHVGLTGWHGRMAPIGRTVAGVLGAVSGKRIDFAPSIFAIARLKKAG